jgi:SOS-response transcriptional repressor LexA
MKQRRKWLEDLFAQTGKTRAGLARQLSVDASRVSEMIAGTRRMTPAEIAGAAVYFGVSPEQLFAAETARTPMATHLQIPAQMPRIDVTWPDTPIIAPPFATMPKDVPVYGTVVGGNSGGFHMNGEVVDRVRRPPGLADVRGAFALYISGDSMEPRYFAGERVYINPARPPAVGDFVVIELRGSDGEAGDTFVKRLVRRTANTVTCQQYNPRDDVTYETAKVKRIWRIVPLDELMGV